MLRLDRKLANIRAGRYRPSDFIIADAKDGDMGAGITCTGFLPGPDGAPGRRRTRAEFLDAIEAIVRQDVVDIMLVSVSNLDLLHERGTFRDSAVKPAIRANDTTDCWGAVRHGRYTSHASRPFRTAHLSQVRYGTETPQPGAPVAGTDLGLYSVTFNNDLDADMASLDAFAAFRREAAANEFKYFYEVFAPNVSTGLDRDEVGEFMNDCILRSLAGVSRADRPQFLKIVYNGPKALEELASFDPGLVVGILGGGAGTTRDTFELLAQAEKYGGRVALFGRKINLAESPLALIALMRQVAEGAVAPEEAVRAYHGELQKAGLLPTRALEDDRAITEAVLKPAATLKAACAAAPEREANDRDAAGGSRPVGGRKGSRRVSAAAARLAGIAASRNKGGRGGFTSVCSAHPLVIEAALRHGLENEADVLIEATCNQINQEGGYTGMTPADFRRMVEGIAATIGFDPGRLVLGGDHLGPNPWRHLPAGEAMGKAAAMVGSYAAAGFAKLHLDTSMGCAGEPEALADAETAKRAARLAGVAESAAREAGTAPPVYVVGTEVPVPGGAWHALDHVQVTVPDAALRTIAVHREAFRAKGLDGAFERAIGAVVQPGVEFGHTDVVTYNRAKAVALSAALDEAPQFVFEAHSTDYQPRQALRSLVEDGFAILKVGPALTFALREALYGLSHIAEILAPDPNCESLPIVMERVMLSSPDNWRKYYPGSETEQRVQRHFSLSDRIRYYWPEAEAGAAVARLMTVLGESSIPSTLISQHLAHLHEGVRLGHVRPVARDLAIASVFRVLDDYAFATRV